MLIECNPRVGGGPVVENNRRLRGVELPYEHMISTLNVPVVCSLVPLSPCRPHLVCRRVALIGQSSWR